MFKIINLVKIVYFENIDDDIFYKYRFIANFFRNKVIKIFSYFEINNFIEVFDYFVVFKTLSSLGFLGLFKLKLLLFNIYNFSFRIFKAYGINMRVIRLFKKKKKNILFLRLGYSHGFFINLSKLLFFRVFKRRYFLLVGNDLDYLRNLSFHIRFLRFFFQYKLIGIKTVRDNFLIKVGKKKNF